MKEVNLKRQNKILWVAIATVLVVATVLSSVLFTIFFLDYGVKPQTDKRAQNVILMIGDGMGINHVKTAELANGNMLTFQKFPIAGEVTTRSLTPGPTDSAAAATAYATGTKTYNRNLSYKDGKSLETLAEQAKKKGMKVGVIATKAVTDATPAAFLTHVRKRSMTGEIAKQIVTSEVDVLFGLNNDELKALAGDIQTANRDYCTTFEQINRSTSEKIFGLIDGEIPCVGRYTLASLTEVALGKLSNENGFFLMVEGSKIDSCSHNNDMEGMLDQLNAFDEAVARALSYAKENGNTTVIVLADHETGDLRIPANATADDISNDWFHSKNHTTQNIGYYAYGVGVTDLPKEIDNTDINYFIRQLLGFDK